MTRSIPITRRQALQALSLLAGGGLAGAVSPAAAQAGWPNRPIKLVLPSGPGGGADIFGRPLAEYMAKELGQPVVVDNRPGAGGNIGADAIAKASPDGLTIGIAATATHAVNPWLYTRMPFDAGKDFTAITQMVRVPNVLVMNAAKAEQLKINSLADLIAYAKANPAKLNYGSGGNGSAGHLAGEMFKAQAGVSLVHIPYAGAAPAQLGLVAGQVDLNFDNLAAAAANIRAGKTRALAVASATRSATLPDVPTFAEAGLPGYEAATNYTLFAPAKTPADVVARLSTEVREVVASADVSKRFTGLGMEPFATTPDQFGSFIRQEVARWHPLIKELNIRLD